MSSSNGIPEPIAVRLEELASVRSKRKRLKNLNAGLLSRERRLKGEIAGEIKSIMGDVLPDEMSRKAEGGVIPKTVRDDVLRQYDGRCAYCGSQGKLKIDHLFPKVRGGIPAKWNLVPACATCNGNKGNGFTFKSVEILLRRVHWAEEQTKYLRERGHYARDGEW